nr:MAG TPA: hypothetical protein [Caudoviricetes sp.]
MEAYFSLYRLNLVTYRIFAYTKEMVSYFFSLC